MFEKRGAKKTPRLLETAALAALVATLGAGTALGTPPTVWIAGACGPEGTTAPQKLDFVVWLSAPAPSAFDLYVHTQSGSAIGCETPEKDCDFIELKAGVSLVSVPPNATSVFVSVDLVQDSEPENPGGSGETFQALLDPSPTGAYVVASGGGAATGTIFDDDPATIPPPRADFNGDGTTDIGWLKAHLTVPDDGLQIIGVEEATTVLPAPPDYHDVPVQPSDPENPLSATFPNPDNGGGPPGDQVHADIVVQKSGTSETYLWARTPLASLGNCLPPATGGHWYSCPVLTPTTGGWRVVSAAEFGLAAGSRGQLPTQGANTPDVLWQSTTDGTDLKIGFLSNDLAVQYRSLTASWNTGGAFKAIGSADLNGDGTPDILWSKVNASGNQDLKLTLTTCQKAANGAVLSCASETEVTFTTTMAPTWNWVLAGFYDVDADGELDLVWNNISSNRVVAWYMDYNAATNEIARRCGGFFYSSSTPPPSEGKKIVLPR